MPVATLACIDGSTVSTDPGATGYLDHIVIFDTAGVPVWVHCSGGISNYYLGDVSPGLPELDPVLIAGAIGAGFFVLLPIWAAVFGFRAIINAIGR